MILYSTYVIINISYNEIKVDYIFIVALTRIFNYHIIHQDLLFLLIY
jgi:hypothetical protein